MRPWNSVSTNLRAALLGMVAGVPTFTLPLGLGMVVVSGLFGSLPNYSLSLLLALAMLPGCALAGALLEPQLGATSRQVPWRQGILGGLLIVAVAAVLFVLWGWGAQKAVKLESLSVIPVLLAMGLCGPIPLLGPMWVALLRRLFGR